MGNTNSCFTINQKSWEYKKTCCSRKYKNYDNWFESFQIQRLWNLAWMFSKDRLTNVWFLSSFRTWFSLAITDFISLTKPDSQVALHASLAETNDSDDFFCITNRTLSMGFLSWTILMYVQTRHSLVRCFALNMWTTWMRSILKFQLIFMGSWNIVVFSMTIQVTYTIANCRFLI